MKNFRVTPDLFLSPRMCSKILRPDVAGLLPPIAFELGFPVAINPFPVAGLLPANLHFQWQSSVPNVSLIMSSRGNRESDSRRTHVADPQVRVLAQPITPEVAPAPNVSLIMSSRGNRESDSRRIHVADPQVRVLAQPITPEVAPSPEPPLPPRTGSGPGTPCRGLPVRSPGSAA